MSNQRQDIALNPSGWSYATEQSSRARRTPPGLDLTDAKKETDEVIPNQLGVMKIHSLMTAFNPGSQQDRNIAGAHGGRVKEEPANGPDWMVIDSIPSLVSRQQGRASDTGHASNSAPVDRPDQMMIESDLSLPGRENLQQDQVSREL
ncbi:hypothetical protein ACKAV7_002225 [Fusarium commune]